MKSYNSNSNTSAKNIINNKMKITKNKKPIYRPNLRNQMLVTRKVWKRCQVDGIKDNHDVQFIRLFIISKIRMWNDLQGGKIMRRQVRDERGRLINKVFRVEKIISNSEYCKIATVIEQEKMMKCTLKIIAKNQRTCKQQIVQQIKNQKKMSLKPHFISLKTVYQDSNTIYLLMQHWGTPLESIIHKRKALTEQQVQLIFCQLVDMLQCLRSANISHGNINLQSVLLSEEKQNHIQLTDFTHSYDLGDLQESKNGTFKFSSSTSQYQSKAKWCLQNTISNDDMQDDGNSLLKGAKQINDYTSPQEYNDDRNLSKVSYCRDIWSCGVLIYKLLTGIYPFSNQSGKLIINKIKNATFSFPTLEEAKCALEEDLTSILKTKNGLELISTEWKELLKRMLSLKDQRITLNQLIEHPLKKHYFQLKIIDNIRCSLPNLKCLFSVKPKKQKNIFQKAWEINFQQKQQQFILSQLQQVQSCHYTDESLKRNEDIRYQKIKIPQQTSYKHEDQSLRGSIYIQKSKDSDKKIQQQKHVRQHKTQFGFVQQSCKSIEHQRHQTAMVGRQKPRKQKQLSIFTPTIKKTQNYQMPEIVRQPPFIVKFKFLKKSNCLTYILNNAVGVVYEDGDHLIGHTKNQYRYIQQDPSKESSELLIDNLQVLNNTKRIKQSFRRGFRNIANLKNSIGDIKMMGKNKTNFTSEQNSMNNFDHVIPKYTTSNLIDSSEKRQILCRQKYSLYVKALDRFGQRVVKGELNIWVDKFWKDGNVFVFLLNNGCWQVAFLEFRGFRIYAVDQFNISWTNCESSSDILQCVRDQIKKYQIQAKLNK